MPSARPTVGRQPRLARAGSGSARSSRSSGRSPTAPNAGAIAVPMAAATSRTVSRIDTSVPEPMSNTPGLAVGGGEERVDDVLDVDPVDAALPLLTAGRRPSANAATTGRRTSAHGPADDAAEHVGDAGARARDEHREGRGEHLHRGD